MSEPKFEGLPSENEFLSRWVPTLPQAVHIDRETALSWREQVKAIEPDRFAWHFRRLFGIGGSEIGEIVAQSRDEPCQFQTPREIALSKLMRSAPTGQDPVLRRGVLMEPVIRQVFHEDFDVVPMERQRAVIEAYRDLDHPWMRGNLDDFVLFERRPCIVDYKAPGEVHGEVPLLYICQLHQYGHLYLGARAQGLAVHPDEIEPPSLINVRFHYSSGCARLATVRWSDEIHAAILAAGDTFWESVLAGQIPDWAPRKQKVLKLNEVERNHLASLEDSLVRALLLREATEAARTEISEAMVQVVTQGGSRLVHDHKPDLFGLTMGVRRAVDEDLYTRLATNNKQAVQDLSVATSKFDTEAMAARLSELGEDPSRYRILAPDLEQVLRFCEERGLAPAVRETVFFSVSRKKAVAGQINLVRESAVRVAQEAMQRIGDEDMRLVEEIRPA